MLGTSMPCLAEWGSGLNKNMVSFGERLLFVGILQQIPHIAEMFLLWVVGNDNRLENDVSKNKTQVSNRKKSSVNLILKNFTIILPSN